MRYLFFLFFTAASFPTFAQATDSIAISKVLSNQLEEWNKGSVEGFMKGYWNSKDLRFVTTKGVKYGWQTVTDSYKKNYPTAEAMGQLDFKLDRISEITKGIYMVTGTWLVTGKEGNKSGYFSLLFKKIKDHWLIIVDHTF